jgi:hypothetical protein
MKTGRKIWLLPIAIFLITIASLTPIIRSFPQHGDEKIYVWKAWYYSNKILHLEFDWGDPLSIDPGFNPFSFWAQEQPFGSHILYAAIMHIFNLPPPVAPYSFTNPSMQGQDTDIPDLTLISLRLVGIISAATGLALITYRFGWSGVFASILLIAIPHVRPDLARAWAEGPLLLGLGLCAISYRTRWFPVACGAAAAFKLTALVLWPLMLLRGANGNLGRLATIQSVLLCLGVFWLLNPISWFYLGPFFLIQLLHHRIATYIGQSQTDPYVLGLFIPTRYLWPLELLAFLAMARLIALIHKTRQINRI